MFVVKRISLFIVFGSLFVGSVFAQTVTGTLQGTITDKSGGALHGDAGKRAAGFVGDRSLESPGDGLREYGPHEERPENDEKRNPLNDKHDPLRIVSSSEAAETAKDLRMPDLRSFAPLRMTLIDDAKSELEHSRRRQRRGSRAGARRGDVRGLRHFSECRRTVEIISRIPPAR